MVNVATNSLKGEQNPWFLVLFYFLGVMSSCHGQFQATNVISLSIVLGRGCTIGSHAHYWLQVKFWDCLAWGTNWECGNRSNHMYSLIHLLHLGPSRNDVINSELYCFGPAYTLDSDSFPVYEFCFLILDAWFLPCQKKSFVGFFMFLWSCIPLGT